MPTATYIALANTTLSASAGSVTFSSIPATYRDLVIVGANLLRTSSGAGSIATAIRFNADTGTNYNWVRMLGLSAGVFSQTGTNVSSMEDFVGLLDQTTPSISKVDIMDYSATDKHKTGLSRWNAQGATVTANAFRWASTNAITSITIRTIDANNGSDSGAFASGSTFALYGIVS